MSYNKERAKRPLTLESRDEVTLLEREQRHSVKFGKRNDHRMPSNEYVELRDKYIAAIELLESYRKGIM